MPEEANSSKVFRAISELSPFVVVAIGLIYTVGLFIVNLNLRTEGLVELDLAKPGYLLVGGLWALLVATLLSFYFLARGELEQLKTGNFWRKITWERMKRWGSFASGVVLFVLFALFIARWKVDPVSGAKYFGSIILSAALFIPGRTTRETFRNLLGRGKFEPKVFFEILTTIVMIVFGLVIYSLYAYPLIIRGIGGGYEPTVELVLSGPSSIPWKTARIATSSGGQLVGPVRLILETDSYLYVGSGPPPGNTPGKRITIAIRKESLSAVLYMWDSHPAPIVWLKSLLLSPRPEAGVQMPPPSATPTSTPQTTN